MKTMMMMIPCLKIGFEHIVPTSWTFETHQIPRRLRKVLAWIFQKYIMYNSPVLQSICGYVCMHETKFRLTTCCKCGVNAIGDFYYRAY